MELQLCVRIFAIYIFTFVDSCLLAPWVAVQISRLVTRALLSCIHSSLCVLCVLCMLCVLCVLYVLHVWCFVCFVFEARKCTV
jgi:hypothetical protein